MLICEQKKGGCMEFTELINNRISIRSYDKDRPIPKNILNKILKAGWIAPSAANRQPWKFVVVSSPEMLGKVKECYDRDWFQNAPHILIVKGNRKEAWTRKYDDYNALETDLTIAMDHLILAAENEGLGTCWIAAFKPEILRTALGLNDDEEVFSITPLGYTESSYEKVVKKKRKNFDKVVEFI